MMKSKLPAAEKFEEWVVGQVLPSIRKTGSFSTQGPNNSKIVGELAILECFDRLALERIKPCGSPAFVNTRSSLWLPLAAEGGRRVVSGA